RAAGPRHDPLGVPAPRSKTVSKQKKHLTMIGVDFVMLALNIWCIGMTTEDGPLWWLFLWVPMTIFWAYSAGRDIDLYRMSRPVRQKVLSEGEQAWLRTHAQSCPVCRKGLDK